MTKYGKTKKLMKETGISKKEAQDYLRRAGWDYEKAKQLWAISNFQGINIKKLCDIVVQAAQQLIEIMAPIIKDISEAAAAGASKEEIMDRLGIASEKGVEEE